MTKPVLSAAVYEALPTTKLPNLKVVDTFNVPARRYTKLRQGVTRHTKTQ